MAKNELEKALELVDSEIKKSGISRREAFKLAGLGSAAYLMGGSEAEASTELRASDATGKILIIGGGLAGISTAARLVNTLIHQYFIKKGQLGLEQAKEISFQKKLSF